MILMTYTVSYYVTQVAIAHFLSIWGTRLSESLRKALHIENWAQCIIAIFFKDVEVCY